MFSESSTHDRLPSAARHRSATPRVSLVSASEFESLVPALTLLLAETVNGGAGLGFVPPVVPARVRDYWRALLPELRAESRLLFVATLDGRIVGSGQLWLPQWPSAMHRAEVQKLFVDREARRRRIGALLMASLHDAARQRERSLVVLHTRCGEPPERFYRRLGYKDVGVLPGGARGAAGERHDVLTLYQELAAS